MAINPEPGKTVVVNCPHCGRKLGAPEFLAGREAKCPHCEKRLRVPYSISSVLRAVDAPPESAAEPPEIPRLPEYERPDWERFTKKLFAPEAGVADFKLPQCHFFLVAVGWICVILAAFSLLFAVLTLIPFGGGEGGTSTPLTVVDIGRFMKFLVVALLAILSLFWGAMYEITRVIRRVDLAAVRFLQGKLPMPPDEKTQE